jgi:integrase
MPRLDVAEDAAVHRRATAEDAQPKTAHASRFAHVGHGVKHHVVMEILGHSRISVTMNTYTHVTPASSREVVALVEGLLLDGRTELE